MEEVTVTIVVDNNAVESLCSEHGFSLWIKAYGQNILFDTGQQSSTLLNNTGALHIDLSETDSLILSHGHYDHTGGLPAITALMSPKIKLYYHPALLSARYSVVKEAATAIGVTDSVISELKDIPAEHKFPGKGPVQVSENVFLTGEIERNNNFEHIEEPFYLDPEGTIPDPITDDQSIFIKTGKGLVVCTGCCHSGIINTLTHIRNISGEDRVHTLLGGLHLRNATDKRLERTIEELRQFSLKQIFACHCTGDKAVQRLSESFQCTRGYAGLKVVFSDNP